jgi:NTP pyrophosphatase (non-canonical NTP hydrolase)
MFSKYNDGYFDADVYDTPEALLEAVAEELGCWLHEWPDKDGWVLTRKPAPDDEWEKWTTELAGVLWHLAKGEGIGNIPSLKDVLMRMPKR